MQEYTFSENGHGAAAHFFSMANILMAFVLLLHMNKCRIHVVYVELSVSLLVY